METTTFKCEFGYLNVPTGLTNHLLYHSRLNWVEKAARWDHSTVMRVVKKSDVDEFIRVINEQAI
jgi:hypothetical protein